jgi:hypothetical protein
MSSAVYQLAASTTTEFDDVDPENRYFWRFDRRRLDAEEIRDALLMVSGSLDTEVGGPSRPLDRDDHDRRTLYGEVSRFQLDTYLQTFDFPNPNLTAERRFSTNVPLQSLYFMNSPFVTAQAEALVRRLAEETAPEVIAEAGGQNDGPDDPPVQDRADDDGSELPEHFDDEALVRAAYPLLYSREATDEEVSLALTFLGAQRASWAAQLEEEDAEEADVASDEAASEEDAAAAAAEAEDARDAENPEAEAELLGRRASLAAWTQYVRALVSAAEFRFIS